MLSRADLYDISQDRIAKGDVDAELCRELLDEIHRLRGLVEDLVDFRASKKHDDLIAELRQIRKSVEKGDNA